MAQFVLKINMGNEGMKNDLDIAESLIRCANFIKTDGLMDSTIRDINGNNVGSWSFVGEQI